MLAITIVNLGAMFGAVGIIIIAVLFTALLWAIRRAGAADGLRQALAAKTLEADAVRARADRLHSNLDTVLGNLQAELRQDHGALSDQLKREHQQNLDALRRIEEELKKLGKREL